jgi:rhodanese-related sulfurtransferase
MSQFATRRAPAQLDHAQVQAELERGARYLDVRTPQEFELGHVPGALNVPWALGSVTGLTQNHQFSATLLAQLPMHERVIVGCHSGGRALQAAAVLLASGYRDVSIHEDGWGGKSDVFGRRSKGWQAAGYRWEGSISRP